MRSHFIWKYFRMIFDIYNNFDLTIYNVNKSLFIISNIISPYSKGTNITIAYTNFQNNYKSGLSTFTKRFPVK